MVHAVVCRTETYSLRFTLMFIHMVRAGNQYLPLVIHERLLLQQSGSFRLSAGKLKRIKNITTNIFYC